MRLRYSSSLSCCSSSPVSVLFAKSAWNRSWLLIPLSFGEELRVSAKHFDECLNFCLGGFAEFDEIVDLPSGKEVERVRCGRAPCPRGLLARPAE